MPPDWASAVQFEGTRLHPRSTRSLRSQRRVADAPRNDIIEDSYVDLLNLTATKRCFYTRYGTATKAYTSGSKSRVLGVASVSPWRDPVLPLEAPV